MGRNRIVSPETIRLPLSDGDFLTVKKELNAGEYHRSADGGDGRRRSSRSSSPISSAGRWSARTTRRSRFTSGCPLDERRDVLRESRHGDDHRDRRGDQAHEAANDLRACRKKNDPRTRTRIMTDLAIVRDHWAQLHRRAGVTA